MSTASAIPVRSSPARSALALAGWLAVTFAAATMGAFFLPGEWYARLQKPPWNPPNWIFGPVWTVLYAVMAVAAWLVWKRGGLTAQRTALSLFFLQLLFNALWSPLFFGLHRPGLAFVDLLLLWTVLLGTVAAFWKAHRPAGGMMLPYLVWVTFAGTLNFAVWRLNP
jgi:translocator protein